MAKSKHRGVRLTQVNGFWTARWTDPVTKKTTQRRLLPADAATKATRERWCVEQLKELQKVKACVTGAGPAPTITTIEQLVTDFLATYAHGASARTRRSILTAFTTWCTERGLKLTRDLRDIDLIAWSDYVHRPSNPHKPSTQNRWVKVTGTMLRWAIKRKKCPLLAKADVGDGLEAVAEPKPKKDFLRPTEIQRLLKAWMEDDDAYDGAPTAHVALALLLTGCRKSELLGDPKANNRPLLWTDVDLEHGELDLAADRVKTGEARAVAFKVTPALGELLAALHERSGGLGPVFGKATIPMLDKAAKRVSKALGREIRPHTLRRTCGTILTCAPGIFGAASAWLSAKRLGHSVKEAEKSYVGVLTDLPAAATTFEAAASIECLATEIIDRVKRRGPTSATGAA